MYGALRNRAYNLSQLAGLSTAVLVTPVVGYALANGFAMDLHRIVEQPITFTPMIDDSIPDQQDNQDLPLLDAPPLPVPAPRAPDDVFKTDDVIITAPPASEEAPIAKRGSARARAPSCCRKLRRPIRRRPFDTTSRASQDLKFASIRRAVSAQPALSRAAGQKRSMIHRSNGCARHDSRLLNSMALHNPSAVTPSPTNGSWKIPAGKR